MKRFLLLRMTVVFLAAALPCVVLAQAQPTPSVPSAPRPVQPAPKPGLVLPITAAPKTDLLAGVRSHAARLRAVPIPGGPKSLHENSAQRAVDQVKVLHNWNGDPKSAGWAFNVAKSK
jgi:hypothetical protein